jgi:formate dehydrogenase major subunit
VNWSEAASPEAAPSFAAGSAPPAAPSPPEGGITLVTGTLLNHSGTVTRHCPGLNEVVPEALLRIHPADASKAGLEDGDRVRLKGAGGSVEVKVSLDDTMSPGSGFLPVHFEAVRANMLVPGPDGSGEKVPGTVTLEKVPEPVKAG